MSFSKLLIANRGEIACRVIHSAKALGYRTVAVFSDADADALHVQLADEALRIGPPAVGESYLKIEAILEATRRSGADAVHPGYGFLSENEAFADACGKAGLVFVGPPPAAIAAMGNKAAAKRRMEQAGVPCVPGYQGAAQDDATLLKEARRIGLPLMVKAAAGGGGRGMRLVNEERDLGDAIQSARAEAEHAFGSGELILEKAVREARHVEIQVFADAHGNVVHLGERDCSVQRRHQKVIEEAPSPAVSDELRGRMGAAAVTAARAIGYRSAGTVEFLLDADGHFYFLEMNTRLQVEHPVTEMVTGLDLVALQLRIAAGDKLPFTQEQVRLAGHAVEVRLYAEDAYAGFLPQTGRVLAWQPAGGVRTDHGMRDGQAISPFYDPMIAKLIAHAPSRAEACRKLAAALEDTVVLGPTTNRHFLVAMLRHPAFLAGEATTSFIGTHFAAPQPPAPSAAHWAIAAALTWHHRANGTPDGFRGWRNSNPIAAPLVLATGNERRRLRLEPLSLDTVRVSGDGETHVVGIGARNGHWQRVAVDGLWRRVQCLVDGAALLVDMDALALRFEDRTLEPPKPAEAGGDGRLLAPMDGRVVAVRVAAGDQVEKGQTLVVLEAMKIQHQLKVGVAGTVRSIAVKEGDQVSTRAVLVTVEVDMSGSPGA
jgi:geranyl-CoA carboxylase alpha subunit